jgi:predicted ATPase
MGDALMISLRRAHLDDHWRAVYKRNFHVSLNEISLSGGDIFNDAKLGLNSGINAIIGKNGMGKTNFIRTIYNSFATENSNREKFAKLLDSSNLNVEVTIDGTEHSLALSPNSETMGHEGILCLIFDPCSLIPEIQKLFHNQGNIEELLESFSSVTLGNDDLKLVNFITNGAYIKIEVINIEDEFVPFPILPFFRVEKENSSYDSRTMGLGELSLLYFYWLTDYIKKSNDTCLLLIEEPESFLPPLLQNRFCDVVAMVTANQGNACIISTHSEHILKKIPRTHIHAMGTISGEVKFLSASSNLEQMATLGLTSPKKGIIYFEDTAALLFLKALIRASPLFVIDSFYYHKSGSEAEVIRDLRRFPTKLRHFTFIAAFDGDCRCRLDNSLKDLKNYIYLPTKNSPEEIFIPYICQLDMDDFSSYLRKTTEAIYAALEVAAGSDHHDYFIEMAKALDIEYEYLFLKIADLWISDPANEDDVHPFFLELTSIASQ